MVKLREESKEGKSCNVRGEIFKVEISPILAEVPEPPPIAVPAKSNATGPAPAPCHFSRVHSRIRFPGFLRHQPCRRLQPADDCGGQQRLRRLLIHRVHHRIEPEVPSGAEIGGRRCLTERLRCIWEPRVLLQGNVQFAGNVQAVGVQERLP
ncbi:unnamed protein product [Linum trigynum]|uniref:Uncharacterized protein n=1 Tax=Linum trigynum TaxID=586398 RepID=A0AAV2F2X6_9ROSI